MPFQGDLGVLEEGVAVLVVLMEWAEIQRMKTLDQRGMKRIWCGKLRQGKKMKGGDPKDGLW